MQHYTIISASDAYLKTAWQEWRDLVGVSEQVATLDEGVLLVTTEREFEAVAKKWRDSPPIFTRHINPVDEIIELSGEKSDLDLFVETAGKSVVIPESMRFSVQTRLFERPDYKPFDINKAVSKKLSESGAEIDVRNPQYVVSVAVGKVQGVLVGMVGASDVTLNLSDWAGGERRFRRDDERISRAEFKLEEALEQFGITLPKMGLALDLGAAPGGWTRILRKNIPDMPVIAVDPAELDSRLSKDWSVRYERTWADKYLRKIDQNQRFDIIVNDMRLDATDSAELLLQYAPFLRYGGDAIMTIKLQDGDPMPEIGATVEILREGYDVKSIRHLFHNRQEVTLHLKTRG